MKKKGKTIKKEKNREKEKAKEILIPISLQQNVVTHRYFKL